ncbi:efflux RND transporter periplasmic adaptor subunit, partial [Roseateles saccharophilus]
TAQALASHDGTIEAVRQTLVSAQVAGAVVALPVKAGDRVKAGQLLARLDARAAEQQAGAAAAQVEAARAAQQVATLEMQRQRQLFASRFISQAALDRAEAQFKTATAQAQAQLAAAQAARTESGYFIVRAPYDAVVSELSVMPGDMAMPGHALLTLFDPAALRVAVAVPESAAAALRRQLASPVAVEIAGQRITAPRWEVLPAADPVTHTVTVRIDLPAGSAAAPGGFARAWLPLAAQAGAAGRVFVPSRALVQRAELKGVYVIAPDGRALLRQVRTGPAGADQTEVLAGLAAGERIALDPQAAARRP